jgi:hypothetical protein
MAVVPFVGAREFGKNMRTDAFSHDLFSHQVGTNSAFKAIGGAIESFRAGVRDDTRIFETADEEAADWENMPSIPLDHVKSVCPIRVLSTWASV